ncbi:hypothetical protein CK203_035175 [Vitis vinifera]|uniref:DC1 domain-containing protein n=1 Tax=Vitis vinifera TaxID=29760 RepID=A0A438HAE1_VITVI|nr:hypothetical protein CK203_035175 [Vitis vinifera]
MESTAQAAGHSARTLHTPAGSATSSSIWNVGMRTGQWSTHRMNCTISPLCHTPLTLLAPSFCNACGAPGSSFSYCCSLCEFDLHIRCALLPAIISHRAHPHELSLTYGLGPQAKADGVSGNAAVEAGPGFYKEENGSGSSQNGSKPAEVEDPVLATQLELMRLQQELELSNQLAKMMASYNLSSLV